MNADLKQKPTAPMWLRRFVEESNRIEGITRPATSSEFNAHAAFLSLSHVSMDDLSLFVRICAPGHCLRDIAGFNVRVGNYVAPAGGPEIATALCGLLETLHDRTPRQNHVAYETLHPFTDGNGRSGRVLWLWQHLNSPDGMPGRAKGLGFLHTYYYETLAESRFEAVGVSCEALKSFLGGKTPEKLRQKMGRVVAGILFDERWGDLTEDDRSNALHAAEAAVMEFATYALADAEAAREERDTPANVVGKGK